MTLNNELLISWALQVILSLDLSDDIRIALRTKLGDAGITTGEAVHTILKSPDVSEENCVRLLKRIVTTDHIINTLAVADLSETHCIALEKKLRTGININKIHASNKRALAYLDGPTRSEEKQMWLCVRQSLLAWELPWRHRTAADDPILGPGAFRASLSGPQRDLLHHAPNSFDLQQLSKAELDFVFFAAFAKVGPLTLEDFKALYETCHKYAITGARIRELIDRYMVNDKFLYRLSSYPTKQPSECRAKSKRKLDKTEDMEGERH